MPIEDIWTEIVICSVVILILIFFVVREGYDVKRNRDHSIQTKDASGIRWLAWAQGFYCGLLYIVCIYFAGLLYHWFLITPK